MEWPIKKDDGKYSTTPTAKAIWKTAMEATDDEDEKHEWVASLESAKNWRKDYIRVLEGFTSIVANTSPENAIRIAEAGLEAVHNTLVFTKGDGSISARDAFFGDSDVPTLESSVYSKPEASTGSYQFVIASPRNEWLKGDDAKKQLQAWADYGAMEPSAAALASKVCSMEDCSSLVTSKVFVLLGGTSAMGPAKSLLRIPGAHIMAVARDGKRLEGLVEWFEENAAVGTTMEVGPSDMMKQGPSIAKWIAEMCNKHRKKVIVCNLAYMDGEAHVRVSAAMDLIGDFVSEKLGRNRVCLAYLTTPGLAFPIPPEAAEDAHRRFKAASSWQYLTSLVPGWMQASKSWETPGHICNSMAGIQGPNYALAKTLQYWRCMVAYSKHNQVVSAPLAPGARTESMVRYDAVASALEGGQFFAPILAFSVESASSLMTAILLEQVSRTEQPNLEHPVQIVWDGSVHGGYWRTPYTLDSIGVASYLLGKTVRAPFIPKGSLPE